MLFFRCFIACLFLLLCPQASFSASLLGACADSNKAPNECSKSRLAFPVFKEVAGKASVLYKTDLNDLGDIDSATATQAVRDMLDIWENNSSLDFVNGGTLSSPVTADNYTAILEPSSKLGFSPIVFDKDGSITDEYFGQGSKTSVLGFAGAVFYSTMDGLINNISESQGVFNGYLFSAENRSLDSEDLLTEFKSTILHEFGHMVGLDHTQGGEIDTFNSLLTDSSDYVHIPIMFPIAANPLIELQRDDLSAIRLAYPSEDLSLSTATIEGVVTKDGVPVKGANVIAFNTSSPLEENVACPSDVDGQGKGAFVLPFLTPVEYILKVEPIDKEFTGGSSVGIHEPPNLGSVSPGFYVANDQSIYKSKLLETGLENATRITVNAGENKNNLVLEIGSPAPSDSASFYLTGKAFYQGIVLKYSGYKSSKFNIKKLGTGKRRIKLSTNYPDIVQFFPSDTITIGSKKSSSTVNVVFSPFADFASAFPDIDTDGASVSLRVEDLDSGYIDESRYFLLY